MPLGVAGVYAAVSPRLCPTDHITVPDALEPMTVEDLVSQGLARRPELAQAQLQAEAGKISAGASRNNALPQLNVFANVETRRRE